MSTLLIEELYSGVVFEQTVRIRTNLNLAIIRPWIYKQGTLQDGKFRIQVYDDNVLLKTVDIDYTDINSQITSPYAHGYISFDMDPLILGVDIDDDYRDYRFEFSMVNHTTNINNYLAICREWDIQKYPLIDVVDDDATDPAGYEIYGYRVKAWQR